MNDINAINSNQEKIIIPLPEAPQQKKKTQEVELYQAKALSKEEIEKILEKTSTKIDTEKLLQQIAQFNTELHDKEVKLSYNEKINRIIITIVNKQKNEIIKEYPCEDLQKLAMHLKNMIGVLFDSQV
ncbi:MAG: flagellar protein FlaG [Spirochaetes bacterium]|nr:flagellar protein FlaG [Spirochaetota bacterium]